MQNNQGWIRESESCKPARRYHSARKTPNLVKRQTTIRGTVRQTAPSTSPPSFVLRVARFHYRDSATVIHPKTPVAASETIGRVALLAVPSCAPAFARTRRRDFAAVSA